MENWTHSTNEDQFQPGITVRILEGPFKDFIGKIQQVDQSKKRAVIAVNFFIREVTAELSYSQMAVQK